MDAWKKIGLWFVVVLGIVAVFRPLRNHFAQQAQEEKYLRQMQFEEQEFLGNIDGYNFRVAQIQRQLKEKGFDPGKIDGRMGEATRRAIRKFQIGVGEKPTGFLNNSTWFKLGESKLASLDKGRPEEPKNDVTKETVRTEIMEYRLRNKNRIKAVQAALKNAGFDPGPIDGKMGEKTKQAVMAFQKKNGFAVDGVVGTKTWEALSRFSTQEKGGVR
jgi:N-acetyl-anhydromuramyl-L-alanine amidase AmpD